MAAPVAAFSADVLYGMNPLTVTFTDASSNSPTSRDWDFGDGTAHDTTQNPVHIYSTAGIQTVTLIATNVDGSDSEVKTNYINVGIPVADFSADDTTVDTGVLVTFTDASINSPTSWTWTFGDGQGSTAQNPTHTYLDSGNYNVVLTATNVNGFSTETKLGYMVVSKGPITADFFTNDTAINQGDDAQFFDLSSGDAIQWLRDFGDGTPGSVIQNPSHTYATPGTFTVSLEAGDGTFLDTETKIDYVVVSSLMPDAEFSADDVNPSTNDVVTFTDESLNSPTSWNWNFGDGTPNSTLQNPTHTYTTPGTYSVSLSATNAFGTNVETKLNYMTVTLGVPVANFTGTPLFGVDPLTVVFTDSSTNTPTSWSWDFGDGTAPAVTQNPTHIYTVPGTYTVELTATNATGDGVRTRIDYVEVSDDYSVIDAYHDKIIKFAYRLPTSFGRIVRKSLRELYTQVEGAPIDEALVDKYTRQLKKIFKSGYSYLVRELREELIDFVDEAITP